MKKVLIGLVAVMFFVGIHSQAAEGAAWGYRAERNGWLTVWGTIDCTTIEPPVLQRAYVRANYVYGGTLPSGSNDFLTKFEWDASCGNVDWHKYAVPFFNSEEEQWELRPLEDWLDSSMPSEGIYIPTFGDSTGVIQSVYVAVNIEQWLADPREGQDTYNVVDGHSPDLPGFLIGTTPIVFNPNGSEPFSTTPLTGTLYLSGETIFAGQVPVPALSEWGIVILFVSLTGSAAVCIAVRRRRKAVAGA